MTRGTLDQAAAAAARWAGIPIAECPLCGEVVETRDLKPGDVWRCDGCGAESVVVDDDPAASEKPCASCAGTRFVAAVDIASGDETETVPCPDCQPFAAAVETGIRGVIDDANAAASIRLDEFLDGLEPKGLAPFLAGPDGRHLYPGSGAP